MPIFEAKVRTVHSEVWEVEAADEDEARKKFEAVDEEVEMGDPGQEIVDWTVGKIKMVKSCS